MKIWLVSRNDSVDYDEYDAKVVRAATEAEALFIASRDEYWDGDAKTMVMDLEKKDDAFPIDDVTVEEVVAEGEPSVILASFNAG